MKAKVAGLTLMLLAAAVMAGCSRESAPGGPGAKNQGNASGNATNAPNAANTKNNNSDDNTFTIEVPKEVNVTQGTNENAKISIDREDNFKQGVKLTFKAPAGIKVTPAEAMIKPDQESTNVVVEAGADVTVGKHQVEVTGAPDTGKPTSVNMTVDVRKK